MSGAPPGVLLTGLGIGESPRWHDGTLWLANWGTGEVLSVDAAGAAHVAAHIPTSIPYSIDWLPDGRMLAVSGQQARLLRREPDGRLVTHAELGHLADVCNEIVVDGRGNAYVNGSVIALVRPDGTARLVADGLAFGNGMAVTPDNGTLLVAESHGNRLTAFDIASDGTLSGRRVWAELPGGYPDGICLDAEGAVWYADVPNRRCVRVREGGAVLRLHARRARPAHPVHPGGQLAGHATSARRLPHRPGAHRTRARARRRLAVTDDEEGPPCGSTC
jgi:sugar lactone lactonase YvrE